MASLGREFIQKVEALCFETLLELGIEKRKAKIGTWDLHGEFHGWIGLNTETRFGDGTMIVNPVVGVRFDPIHRLIAEINEVKYQPYSPATISRFLGNLAPEVLHGFEFSESKDMKHVALQIRSVVVDFGLPYVESNSSVKALESRIPLDCAWEDAGERLLVAMYLRSDRNAVEREIRQRLKDGQSKPVNVKRFEEFSKRFISYMGKCVTRQPNFDPSGR